MTQRLFKNLEVLFGTDPISDVFDVEIPLTNVRRISSATYEISHEGKSVEIVFKSPYRLHRQQEIHCVVQDICDLKMDY